MHSVTLTGMTILKIVDKPITMVICRHINQQEFKADLTFMHSTLGACPLNMLHILLIEPAGT